MDEVNTRNQIGDDPEAAPPPPSAESLAILDSDPVAAEARYRELLRALTRYLEWLRCVEPEEAAQEAISRGLKRLAEGVDISSVGARAYFFGIARNVAHEGWKSRRRERQLDPILWDATASSTRGHQQVEARLMLQKLLRRLDMRDREIILRYCTEKNHDAHCRELGVTAGNLRIIVFRIREKIRELARRDASVSGTRSAV
jgi:RNA polymerase sigma factor (sigma-70 family)